jgi:hypothetical protein
MLGGLREATLEKLAPDFGAGMLGPLVKFVRGFQGTPEELERRLPEVLAKMKDGPLVDQAADLLLQTALIGRTSAMPEELLEPTEPEPVLEVSGAL